MQHFGIGIDIGYRQLPFDALILKADSDADADFGPPQYQLDSI
jgi:hypothetical protein